MSKILSPKTPPKPQVMPMPDEEDPRILLAKRNAVAKAKQSGGQNSTILSMGSRETLGGG